jgi:hypothetical protein
MSIRRYDESRRDDGYDQWLPEEKPRKEYKPKIKPYMTQKFDNKVKFVADSKYVEHSKYLERENIIKNIDKT